MEDLDRFLASHFGRQDATMAAAAKGFEEPQSETERGQRLEQLYRVLADMYTQPSNGPAGPPGPEGMPLRADRGGRSDGALITINWAESENGSVASSQRSTSSSSSSGGISSGRSNESRALPDTSSTTPRPSPCTAVFPLGKETAPSSLSSSTHDREAEQRRLTVKAKIEAMGIDDFSDYHRQLDGLFSTSPPLPPICKTPRRAPPPIPPRPRAMVAAGSSTSVTPGLIVGTPRRHTSPPHMVRPTVTEKAEGVAAAAGTLPLADFSPPSFDESDPRFKRRRGLLVQGAHPIDSPLRDRSVLRHTIDDDDDAAAEEEEEPESDVLSEPRASCDSDASSASRRQAQKEQRALFASFAASHRTQRIVSSTSSASRYSRVSRARSASTDSAASHMEKEEQDGDQEEQDDGSPVRHQRSSSAPGSSSPLKSSSLAYLQPLVSEHEGAPEVSPAASTVSLHSHAPPRPARRLVPPPRLTPAQMQLLQSMRPKQQPSPREERQQAARPEPPQPLLLSSRLPEPQQQQQQQQQQQPPSQPLQPARPEQQTLLLPSRPSILHAKSTAPMQPSPPVSASASFPAQARSPTLARRSQTLPYITSSLPSATPSYQVTFSSSSPPERGPTLTEARQLLSLRFPHLCEPGLTPRRGNEEVVAKQRAALRDGLQLTFRGDATHSLVKFWAIIETRRATWKRVGRAPSGTQAAQTSLGPLPDPWDVAVDRRGLDMDAVVQGTSRWRRQMNLSASPTGDMAGCCPSCEGEGRQACAKCHGAPSTDACWWCRGGGGGGGKPASSSCRQCQGKGVLDCKACSGNLKVDCPTCQGEGHATFVVVLDVRVCRVDFSPVALSDLLLSNSPSATTTALNGTMDNAAHRVRNLAVTKLRRLVAQLLNASSSAASAQSNASSKSSTALSARALRAHCHWQRTKSNLVEVRQGGAQAKYRKPTAYFVLPLDDDLVPAQLSKEEFERSVRRLNDLVEEEEEGEEEGEGRVVVVDEGNAADQREHHQHQHQLRKEEQEEQETAELWKPHSQFKRSKEVHRRTGQDGEEEAVSATSSDDKSTEPRQDDEQQASEEDEVSPRSELSTLPTTPADSFAPLAATEGEDNEGGSSLQRLYLPTLSLSTSTDGGDAFPFLLDDDRLAPFIVEENSAQENKKPVPPLPIGRRGPTSTTKALPAERTVKPPTVQLSQGKHEKPHSNMSASSSLEALMPRRKLLEDMLEELESWS